MTATLRNVRLIVATLFVALSTSSSQAQQLFYDWIGPANSDWNVASSWVGNGLNFVPDANVAAGESARINNGGTAVVKNVVPKIAALNVANGSVRIESNGVLETVVDAFGTGVLSVGSSGSINLQDNGRLTIAGSAANSGTIRLSGPGTAVNIAGSFTNSGSVAANITSATSHGSITAVGDVLLAGTLHVDATGFTPTFGQSWDIVKGASLSGRFSNLVVDSSPPLARGLSYELAETGNTASVRVGNSLILSVDRQSGATSVSNVVGGPVNITSYAIRSTNELLVPGGWTSLADTNSAGPGWTEASPANGHLAELNLQSSYSVPVGQALALGNAYGGATATPAQEDLIFQYSTLDGRLHQGFVEYSGIANDFVLFVDPTNGAAAVGNLSPHIAAPDITGYAIRSAGGQLTQSNWTSFADSGSAGPGWTEANPSPTLLAELNLQNSKVFTNGTLIDLGTVFQPNGMRDLTLEYTTLSGESLMGTVQYGAIPTPPAGVPGDYNGNGTVDAADYVVWRHAVNQSVAPGSGADGNGNGVVDQADYQFWRARFGNVSGSGSSPARTAAVPEPSALLLTMIAAAVAMVAQCRWKS